MVSEPGFRPAPSLSHSVHESQTTRKDAKPSMNFPARSGIALSILIACIAFTLGACASASTSSASESLRSDSEAHGEPESIAGLTFSVSPGRSRDAAHLVQPPLGENVAPLASGLAYIRGPEDHLIVDEEAYLAIDGDTETIWSSKQPAPQWYAIVLDQTYLVDRVELVITQSPPGPTTHEIWLGHGSGLRTFYRRLSNVHTEDGQTLAVAVDPPQSVNEVLILTLQSPSWVAWRDFRVFGTQPESSASVGVKTPYAVTQVATGLQYPVRVTHAGDGSGRIFVVEQPGRIRIVKDGITRSEPFLDISERVNCCIGERGLLGLAFPPSYPSTGRFYVSYTNAVGATTISRIFTSDDPNRADESSEEVILTLDQPHENHNGGHLEFGPLDGLLYIGSGDGGLPRDPENRGQSTDTLLGKLLRIDVESGESPYGIPASNPFVNTDGYRSEIWAMGLRNPWGFAFDERSGDLYLPDTGNFKREEVNYQPAGSRGGRNYGWPVMEGSICFEHDILACSAQGLTLPVADYDQTHGCAIVGGAVYTGVAYADLLGEFIVADYCTGRIWGISQLERVGAPAGQISWRSARLASAGMPVSSVGSDEEGNVYFTGHAPDSGILFILSER
ncbi:MAG: hypothetical protein F4047_02865 [Caldilineaceae bacterium SB0670_bin_27]|nr:hypothetical protein [Caldilineaceae bacterium SB0670_bin_27]